MLCITLDLQEQFIECIETSKERCVLFTELSSSLSVEFQTG